MSDCVRITAAAREGELSAIPSKSDAHRALIAAAMAGEPTEILFRGGSDDISTTLACLSQMGARITPMADGYRVASGEWREAPLLSAKESGSTLRFLLPVTAALGMSASFAGEGRLPMRPMAPLLDALREHGVTADGEHLPLSLGGKMTAGDYRILGNVSSQFISGLLFALPLLPGESTISLTSALESAAYVDMTVDTLSRFGVHWRRRDGQFVQDEGGYRSCGRYTVEGDYSSAAFPLVMGAISGRVTVSGLKPETHQADRAILDVLRLAGAFVVEDKMGVTVESGALSPFFYDVSGCPDLFPILAVLAAAAPGESRLTGGARLRLKESDRIRSSADMLSSLGADITPTEDGMIIRGGRRLSGGVVDGAGDHRIVMAAAAARALADSDIVIRGASAVSKSYPSFFSDYACMKGESHEIILR